MAQELYNEGRVVGLSAYELFVKQAIANGVEDVPTEAQWLTSMIGSGSSLILRVPANTAVGVREYELPNGSNLTAAGVVIASPFIGNCEWDSGTWATKVTSYGALIENDATKSPSADGNTVPTADNYTDIDYYNNIGEFVKITDGIVYTKTATWIPTGDVPEKDINPEFSTSSTVVRLYLSSTLKSEVHILLTGFNNKNILQGLSAHAEDDGQGISAGGSTDITMNDWVNGGMIGPEIIPWASKIIFTVPSSTYNLVNSIKRTIPAGVASATATIGSYNLTNLKESKVNTNSVIDFNSIDLTQYYTVHRNNHEYDTPGTEPTIGMTVQQAISGSGDSSNTLVAWYPGITAGVIADPQTSNNQFFPPALYAAKISSTGDKLLVPIDVAAPGTVKGFSDPDQAYYYKHLMKGNYAIYYNSTLNTYSFVIDDNDRTKWSGTAKISYIANTPKVEITAGDVKVKAIALNSLSGSTYTDYNTSGSNGNIVTSPLGKISWDTMLSALSAGKTVDTLGERMSALGVEVNRDNAIGINNTSSTKPLANIGTNNLRLTGSNPVNLSSTSSNNTNLASVDTSVKLGRNFIEFTDTEDSNRKLRLYISNKSGGPSTTNVPVGSIGIGW